MTFLQCQKKVIFFAYYILIWYYIFIVPYE